jgi:ADP-ribose pyrophosphatase YjhB (NUDIX family)
MMTSFPIDDEGTVSLRLSGAEGSWTLELVPAAGTRRFALERALRRHLRVLSPGFEARSFPPETDRIALPADAVRVDVVLGDREPRRLVALELGSGARVLGTYRLAPFETRFLADNGHPHPPGAEDSGPALLTTDLHTHFAGCVRPEDLVATGVACGVSYPADLLEQAGIRTGKKDQIPLAELSPDLRALLAARLALPLDRQVPFAELETVYRLRGPITKHPAAFVPLLRRVALDYARMGVTWAELSFFGILEGERLEAAHRELPAIERETGVSLRFLAALGRHDDAEWDLDLLDRIDQLAASRYLAGVDFMGQETNSTLEFARQLQAVADWAHARRPGFVVRVHAGENPAYPENVRLAVETVTGRQVRLRIGHGLYGTDERTLALLRETGTIVEFNLNSNFALNNLESAREIPLRRYLEAEVSCVLGTDGYGIYGTSLELEARVARLAGLTGQDLERIRATERRYREERSGHEASLVAGGFKAPPPAPPRHYTPEVAERRRALVLRRDRALEDRLRELAVPLLSAGETSALLGARRVVSVAGAWRKSWDALSPASQERVRRELAALARGLDPGTVLVAGGTGSGVEGIAQREARSRGLTVLGTLVRETPADGLERDLLTHATLVAEKLHDKAAGLYPLVKRHGGLCLFLGGGHIVADEIQAAANLRLPYLVLEGIEGASGLHAESVPERAFRSAEEVLARLRSSAPWPSTRDPYWHTGVNPVVDMVVVREEPATGCRQILLVRRSDDAPSEPGAWALPGGFQQTDAPRGTTWAPGVETAEEAAVRELREETGLDVSGVLDRLVPVGEFEGEGRDPRDTPTAWSRSRAFALRLPPALLGAAIAGGDDAASASWIGLAELPRLAFDHARILARALERLGLGAS